MSAPKKIKIEEEKTSVSGYVQNVSPIRTSRTNSRYFNAIFQTERNEFNRAACFDVAKHSVLMDASQAHTPLKLLDVQLVPSRIDASKSEVLLNHKTKIEVCRTLNFNFKQSPNDDDKDGEKVKSLAEVQATPEHNKVAVEVKVLSATPVTVQIVRESPIKRQELIISDASAAMKITVWEDLVSKLEVNKCYRIEHLSTRLFMNTKSVTSTKQTTATLIGDITNCVAPTLDSDIITKEGKITQAGLQLFHTCENCKSKVDVTVDKSLYVRCNSCKLKMSKESLHKSITGTICFSSGYEKYKLTIFSSVLFTLASINNVEMEDADSVEEYLLSNSFKVSFSKDNKTVVDIKLSVENVA
ncbi:uncharacterized protein LOC133187078 [Saccostrea echinata]|uniref:uncharacterized protein LOC133172936 n=1 Tax=Saccostrea echinata TaxID=191078 RepID=UPI002A820BA9|nr:uncharacterized protein LOC133172936 [Saccostrea echinata]XP_061178431.1 uncharacterized protein LOC133187078 [Saccostrea echinata]